MNPLKLKKLLDSRYWFEEKLKFAKERIAKACEYADEGNYKMAWELATEVFELANIAEKKVSTILK